jgi:hypothetical protein
MQCVHFVGFRTTGQYWRACQVWGKPDFVHRVWDYRAKFGGERDENDIFVFAKGTEHDEPTPFSFDDSAHM